ncbi:virion structural protein [Pseudomonas phage Psa21]|uniref:Virion structural protein n=1 Tax=Pseudomonas phage Psa21 TaxID=2530023 RepID=A0A481W4P1_9CAUD|nr:virion structural protein [Pseudomonas phage Psa21]QBJ02741.1 virion structural protein [Pseudomonas phage Psa21]
MYNLKGFIGYPSLVNNVPDQVAKFGELSNNSATYAKDKTIHTSTSVPNTVFFSFHSVKDETLTDVDSATKDLVLKLSKYLLDQAIAGAITQDPQVVRQMVLAEFGPLLKSFTTGKMLTNNVIWLPEYVVLEMSQYGDTNRVQLWFADDSFSGQYDEYVIEVVHPLIPYDDFFKDPLVVIEALKAYDLDEKLEEAHSKRAQYPYTHLRSLTYDYVNPRNPTMKQPARWLALLYGIAADNQDFINDKIIEELLANSTHTREEWEAILPDLFKKTEFIITPFWENYSVAAGILGSGFYSPTVDPRKEITLLQRTARGPAYTTAWVNAQYEISSHTYKSLAFGVLGNPQNREGVVRFSAKFPDYLLVTNNTGDFDRVDPETTGEWMIVFANLLKVAETMDRYTSVPLGVSRMIRDGVVYASAMFQRVNYLVVTKASVEEFT